MLGGGTKYTRVVCVFRLGIPYDDVYCLLNCLIIEFINHFCVYAFLSVCCIFYGCITKLGLPIFRIPEKTCNFLFWSTFRERNDLRWTNYVCRYQLFLWIFENRCLFKNIKIPGNFLSIIIHYYLWAVFRLMLSKLK